MSCSHPLHRYPRSVASGPMRSCCNSVVLRCGNSFAMDCGDVVFSRKCLTSARNGWSIFVGSPLLMRCSDIARIAIVLARFMSAFWQ